jgi:hypothetical protein
LFKSDFGLMSLAVIIGVVVIGAVLAKIFANKIDEESRRAGR